MSAYSLLSLPVRKYIYEQKWQRLSKIQEAAITYWNKTDANLILGAPTASGKTEAAFLPAISSIDDFSKGIKILYISPLVALINDQFMRISKLCKDQHITITRWHGEASASKKEKLIKDPAGILLITPESLEALLDLHPERAVTLFENTETIILDEIHSFLGNARGYQLQSLLQRLQLYMANSPRYIAMSATIAKEDAAFVKSFFSNGRDTLVLQDSSKKELESTLCYIGQNQIESYSDRLDMAAASIYPYASKERMLAFVHSKANTETFLNVLQKIKTKKAGTMALFAHYSNLSKEIKLEAERFAKESRGKLFTICCTSTLELGIDIGSVDSVVQYGPIEKASSLGQRLGRSGRRDKPRMLHLVGTDPYAFLLGYSALTLLEEGITDSSMDVIKPYDVFAHQLVALLYENNGLSKENIEAFYKQFPALSWVDDKEFAAVFKHLQKHEYIEDLGGEYIAGKEAEKLLFKGSFFTQFATAREWTFINDGKVIAKMEPPVWLAPGKKLFLAGKAWEVESMDQEKLKAVLIPAKKGKTVSVSGGPLSISRQVAKRMYEIIYENRHLKDSADLQRALYEARDITFEEGSSYVGYDENGNTCIVLDASSKAGSTLAFMLEAIMDLEADYDSKLNRILTLSHPEDLIEALEEAASKRLDKETIYKLLKEDKRTVKLLMEGVKYKDMLPPSIQAKYALENKMDYDEAIELASRIAADYKS